MFFKKTEEDSKTQEDRVKEVERMDKENIQEDDGDWKRKIFSCSFAIF